MKMNDFIKKKQEDSSYYTEITINDIQKPFTILLGPNGTGKSTSLRLMKEKFKKDNIQYVMYSTSRDDVVQKGAPAFGNWDPYLISAAFQSEGERMCTSFYHWEETAMLKAIMTNTEPLYILIDEADSGLSYDRILESLKDLRFILKSELNKNRDIHVVMTANSYELIQGLYDNSLFDEVHDISDLIDIIWLPTKLHFTKLPTYNKFIKLYRDYFVEITSKGGE